MQTRLTIHVEGQRPVIFVAWLTDKMVEVQRTEIQDGALHLLPLDSFIIYKYYAPLGLVPHPAFENLEGLSAQKE